MPTRSVPPLPELDDLSSPPPRDLDPATIRPFSFEEVRALARQAASRGGFDFEDEHELEDYDLWFPAIRSRELRIVELEPVLLLALSGQVPTLVDQTALTPQEIMDRLGEIGVQGWVVATIVTALLIERHIAFFPDATPEEKEAARACRWDGFHCLGTDLDRATMDARGIASVLYDIEQRRARTSHRRGWRRHS